MTFRLYHADFAMEPKPKTHTLLGGIGKHVRNPEYPPNTPTPNLAACGRPWAHADENHRNPLLFFRFLEESGSLWKLPEKGMVAEEGLEPPTRGL